MTCMAGSASLWKIRGKNSFPKTYVRTYRRAAFKNGVYIQPAAIPIKRNGIQDTKLNEYTLFKIVLICFIQVKGSSTWMSPRSTCKQRLALYKMSSFWSKQTVHEHWVVYQEFQPSYDIFRRWCQVLFRPQVPCTPSLNCLITNSALTKSQQPV